MGWRSEAEPLVEYDARVIRVVAVTLYAVAWLIVALGVATGVGGALAFCVQYETDPASVLGAVAFITAGVFGGMIGWVLGFLPKAFAQLLLVLVQIETNTRAA